MILTLRNRLKVLIYLGVVSVLVMSALSGDRGVRFSVKRLSLLELILFSAITAFDRWVWRWWRIPQFLRTGPVLRGTWKGVIRPTDGRTEAIEAYLSIRQTYSGVGLRLMTKESTSDSSSARLTQETGDLSVIEYAYENVPRDAVRDRSPIHFGAARFECVGTHPSTLQGSYFTSRRSTGELEFEERAQVVAQTFADAQKAFL